MGTCDEILVEVFQESEHLGDSGRGRRRWRDLFGQEWVGKSDAAFRLWFLCFLLVTKINS